MNTTEPVTRAFFALVPPASLRRSLGEMARSIARRVGGRPVPADNIHLTLAFIGAWPVARVPMLMELAAGLDGTPDTITLDTLGCFRRAGVAWIGASVPSTALMTLATSLQDALANAGIALDGRPFHPHLTLVRKARAGCPNETAGPFAWTVDEVTLMSSDTRAEGARYAVLGRWPLASRSGGDNESI